jgi:hypothetical protein
VDEVRFIKLGREFSRAIVGRIPADPRILDAGEPRWLWIEACRPDLFDDGMQHISKFRDTG